MAKLEIKKNPFSAVRCLHPRSIYNKYINEFVTVGCGHCDACRMAAADRRTSMLNFVKEISASAFFYFEFSHTIDESKNSSGRMST